MTHKSIVHSETHRLLKEFDNAVYGLVRTIDAFAQENARLAAKLLGVDGVETICGQELFVDLNGYNLTFPFEDDFRSITGVIQSFCDCWFNNPMVAMAVHREHRPANGDVVTGSDKQAGSSIILTVMVGPLLFAELAVAWDEPEFMVIKCWNMSEEKYEREVYPMTWSRVD